MKQFETQLPFDVIVVGAGPGGASAAYHLARGGARVALIDRHQFPRDRVGGSAISVLAQDCLTGMGLTQWAQGYPASREVSFFGPRGTLARLQLPPDRRHALFIPSAELDGALVRAVVAIGVTMMLGTEVVGVHTGAKAVHVHTTGPKLSAQLLVLAEGSQAAIAASLGLVKRDPDFMAIKAQYLYEAGGAAEFHYLPGVLPCPAWALPAGQGFVSVGVSANAGDVRNGRTDLHSLLARFTANQVYGGMLTASEPVRGPTITPIRSSLSSVVPFSERVLLTGEAAGVVHPLTMESIGAAMESGRIVAQHALYALQKQRLSAADLSAYARALRRRFLVEHRAARLLRALLYSERVLERIVGRAQRDPRFALMAANLFIGTQSSLGALTPANLGRYLTWWREPRRRSRR